jgi:elongin-A
MAFIKRDIPDWQTKRHEPTDPKNWYKVYRKLKQEAQKDPSEAILKAALANIQNEKEHNVATLTSRQAPVGPGMRARMTYNYISGKTGSKGASKMTLMEKIRKEARDAKSSRMNRPMHELRKKATAISQPPQQFVEDLKRKPATTQLSPPPRAPMRTSRPPLNAPKARPAAGDSYDLTQDREARLRALKSGGPNSGQNSTPAGSVDLTLDFLEDSDDEQEIKPQRQHLDVEIDRLRSASPMKLKTAATLKRKQAPSMFMSSSKKIAKGPGMT